MTYLAIECKHVRLDRMSQGQLTGCMSSSAMQASQGSPDEAWSVLSARMGEAYAGIELLLRARQVPVVYADLHL